MLRTARALWLLPVFLQRHSTELWGSRSLHSPSPTEGPRACRGDLRTDAERGCGPLWGCVDTGKGRRSIVGTQGGSAGPSWGQCTKHRTCASLHVPSLGLGAVV